MLIQRFIVYVHVIFLQPDLHIDSVSSFLNNM